MRPSHRSSLGLRAAGRTGGGGTMHPDTRGPAPSVLPRRFCSQVTLTPEEREQRALYAAILEYEQDHVSPRADAWAMGCGSGWGSLGSGLPPSPIVGHRVPWA